MKPKLTLIPARPLNDTLQTTDLLVRVTAPTPAQGSVPPLDLVLALDTSGSMRGAPLALAQQATEQVFRQRDAAHLGLVTFSSAAEVVAPLQAWRDDGDFLTAVNRLATGGNTALHAGWQLAKSLLTAPLGNRPQAPHRLQRVLVLTDGRANVGPRRPHDLGAAIRAGLGQGVSTSTVGVGRYFDEQLLEALAAEGDGNYYYANTPQDLGNLFLAELDSLKSSFGRLASLGIDGVEVLDVLNDLPRLRNGRTALPPLQAGRDTEVLIQVRAKAGDRVTLRLAWTDGTGRRHVERTGMNIPAISEGQQVQDHPDVIQLRGTLQIARLQRRIAHSTDLGNANDALLRLSEARAELYALGAQGILIQDDLTRLDSLQARLQRGDHLAASKYARHEAYLSGRSKK